MQFTKNVYGYFYNLWFVKPENYEKKRFIKWINNSNVMIIIRGPLVSKNVELANYFKKIENNEFFGEGHSRESVFTSIERRSKLIVVHLERMTLAAIKPYLEYAQKHFYMTLVSDFLGPEASVYQAVEGDIEEEIPVLFVGWFISNTEEKDLNDFGRQCLTELQNIEDVRIQLETVTGGSDFNEFWPVQKKRLHVTSTYLGGAPEGGAYVKDVSKYLCNTYDITVLGVLLTPRTFSCHVQLPSDGKNLFDDKALVLLKPHITLSVSAGNSAKQSGGDEVEVQTLIADNIVPASSWPTKVGTVSDYGACRFYIKLDTRRVVSALFAPHV